MNGLDLISGIHARTRLSLDGLAIGDAIGEMYFSRPETIAQHFQDDKIPMVTWLHTDDTEMAISVVETLLQKGRLDQNFLAQCFAKRFTQDPLRGYGKGARMILQDIANGLSWQMASKSAFSGAGSMGNGAAMRVGPLGAFFAPDLDRVVYEARLSAEVTHAHREGIAGAIAVSVAAAIAWTARAKPSPEVAKKMFAEVIRRTPSSETQQRIVSAANIDCAIQPAEAAKNLGNGFLVTAQDTVPFALWCAARHLDNYAQALVTTISVGGDCDTNAAIVGSIVALFVGRESTPSSWRACQEAIVLSGAELC